MWTWDILDEDGKRYVVYYDQTIWSSTATKLAGALSRKQMTARTGAWFERRAQRGQSEMFRAEIPPATPAQLHVEHTDTTVSTPVRQHNSEPADR